MILFFTRLLSFLASGFSRDRGNPQIRKIIEDSELVK